MSSEAEFEQYAMELPEKQRATFALHLLNSLPAPLQDQDEGIEEALLRDDEMNARPSMGLSLDEFQVSIRNR